MPLTDHLEELRKRLINCLIAIGVGFGISYGFSKQIFDFLVSPVLKVMPENSHFIYTSLTEAFVTYIKVSFFAGIVLASPVIFYQAWKFVVPALYDSEKKYVLPFVIAATIFFIMGALFAFYVIFPVGFKFFLSYSTQDIYAMPSLKEYLSFVTKFLIAAGLCFELPVIMFFLAKLGVVNKPMLSAKRKYAILIIAIVAAILTPSPDAMSMIMLSIPLLALYELSIWVVYFVDKGIK